MPSLRKLRINIAGTDRTTSIPHDTIQHEESIQDGTTATTTSVRFHILDAGSFSLDTMQVVQLVDPDDSDELYFEGYITGLSETEFRSGVGLDYDVVCSDYSHDTGHGEALINSTYTNTSDSSIIQTELAVATPNLNVTNFVDTLDSSIENLDFSNLTAREMLHQLAILVGATWYVDPQKNLHWFDGENLAPMILTDAPTADQDTIDPEAQGWGAPRFGFTQFGGESTRLVGYRQLTMSKSAPEATQASVIGGGSTTATVSGEQVGGRHMITKVEDPQVTSAAQATQLGTQVLEDADGSATYTLTIDEPGARAGQKVRLINALRSIDDYFMINRVTTKWFPSGHIEATLEIGKHKPTLVEQLSDLSKAVSGGSKAGASTGRAEGTANRNHGHTGGADSPKVGEDAFDTDVQYWGTVSDGTNTADADSAGDTLTFTESTAIDIVVSEDDTVTVAMDGRLRAHGSASATDAPADNTPVSWNSDDDSEITLLSTDNSVTIKGDNANKEIDFAVSSSVGNAFGVIRLNTDGGTLLAEANTTHDLLTLVEGDNITITTTDGGDHTIEIAATAFTGAATAWTTVTADSGTDATADTTTDTIDIAGGTGIDTVSANDPESITISIDSTVAQLAFSTINTTTNGPVVADGPTDTLTLAVASGSNLDIDGTAASDTITFDWTGVSIEDGGSSVGTQPILNFIDGTNISLDLVDDGSEIDITVNTTGVATSAYDTIAGDQGIAVAVTEASGIDFLGGTGIITIATNRVDTSDKITRDEVNISIDAEIDGVSWGSGTAPNIDFTSSSGSITITPDDTNKEINFDVSASVGVLAWTNVMTDDGATAVADAVTDTIAVFGGNGIKTFGYNAPAAGGSEADATEWGAFGWGTAVFGGEGELDYIRISAEYGTTTPADVATTASTGDDVELSRHDHIHRGVHSISANSGTDIYADVNFVDGDGVDITRSGQDITIAVDTGVAQAAFTTVAVPSGTNPEATAPGETLTFTEGIGINIDGSGSDTVDIAFDATLEGIAWPSGDTPNIDLTSTGSTVTITTGASSINFEVTASGLPYAVPALTLGTANTEGSADTVIRTDATILVFDATAPADIGSAGAVGSATVAARRDHVHRGVHSLSANADSDIYADINLADGIGINITRSSQEFIFAIDETENTRYAFKTITDDAAGTATANVVDDSLAILGGTGITTAATDVTNDAKLTVTFDLTDALLYAVPAFSFDSSASVGSANTLVRSDATLAIFDATDPAAVAAAAVVGTAGVAARRDHVHVGVANISANDGTNNVGDVNFDDGTGILITRDNADDFTIAIDPATTTHLAFKTIVNNDGGGTLAEADTVNDTLTFASTDSSITFSTGADDVIDFSVAAGGFGTVKDDGATTGDADSANDTILFSDGAGIVIGVTDTDPGATVLITNDGVRTIGETPAEGGTTSQHDVVFVGNANLRITVDGPPTNQVNFITQGVSTKAWSQLTGPDALGSETNTTIEADSFADVLTFNGGQGVLVTVNKSGGADNISFGFDAAVVEIDLDDLDDVVITSVSDNDVLVYDSGSSQWLNETLTGLPAGTEHWTLRYDVTNGWEQTGSLRIDDPGTSDHISVGDTADPLTSAVVYIDGEAETATVYSVYATTAANAGSGGVDHRGIYSQPEMAVGGSIEEVSGFYAANPTFSSGSMGNSIAYGMYIEDITAGNTDYAIYNAGNAPIWSFGDIVLNADLGDNEIRLRPVTLAASGATTKNAPMLKFEPQYWNGSSSTTYEVELEGRMDSTTPTGSLGFKFDGSTKFLMLADDQNDAGLTWFAGDNNEAGWIWDGTVFEMPIGYAANDTHLRLYNAGANNVDVSIDRNLVVGVDQSTFDSEGHTIRVAVGSLGIDSGDLEVTSGSVGINEAPSSSYGLSVTGAAIISTGDFTVLSGDIKMTTGDVDLLTSGRIVGSTHVNLAPASGSGVFMDFDTEDLILKDSGSTSATEQDWIEVTIGGVTGYIRVYASK